jgi:4-diphosphocytidyl-2C-methyl-D-erythritol kinase
MAAMLRALYAVGAQMTGSGSAVFGLFDSEEAAREAVAAIRARHGRGGSAWSLPFIEAAPFCREALRFEDAF